MDIPSVWRCNPCDQCTFHIAFTDFLVVILEMTAKLSHIFLWFKSMYVNKGVNITQKLKIIEIKSSVKVPTVAACKHFLGWIVINLKIWLREIKNAWNNKWNNSAFEICCKLKQIVISDVRFIIAEHYYFATFLITSSLFIRWFSWFLLLRLHWVYRLMVGFGLESPLLALSCIQFQLWLLRTALRLHTKYIVSIVRYVRKKNNQLKSQYSVCECVHYVAKFGVEKTWQLIEKGNLSAAKS